ncbi:MAG: hypothetical protein ACEQSK_00530 [Sphingomonadaceae bacterium]
MGCPKKQRHPRPVVVKKASKSGFYHGGMGLPADPLAGPANAGIAGRHSAAASPDWPENFSKRTKKQQQFNILFGSLCCGSAT